MDVAITRNIFVRAEFEYVRFAPIMNTVLAVESARVGAGLKF
jgi:opacity protein-like surface antigen